MLLTPALALLLAWPARPRLLLVMRCAVCDLLLAPSRRVLLDLYLPLIALLSAAQAIGLSLEPESNCDGG